METTQNVRILSADTCMQMFGTFEPHYQLLRLDGTPVIGGVFKIRKEQQNVAPGLSSELPPKQAVKPYRELGEDEGWIRVETRRQRRMRRKLRELRGEI
jgi:hypothetical protein